MSVFSHSKSACWVSYVCTIRFDSLRLFCWCLTAYTTICYTELKYREWNQNRREKLYKKSFATTLSSSNSFDAYPYLLIYKTNHHSIHLGYEISPLMRHQNVIYMAQQLTYKCPFRRFWHAKTIAHNAALWQLCARCMLNICEMVVMLVGLLKSLVLITLKF